MNMKETAIKNRKTRLNHILASAGMRMIDGKIAETPEKYPEEQRGNHDRHRIINTM